MMTESIRRNSISFILILWTVVLLQGCQTSQHSFHGSPYSELNPAPSFVLTRTNGEQLLFPEGIEGISLIFFGYTHCPDVCPGTAAQMKWVFNQLGESSEQVNFIFITVDPERDQPEIIENFLYRFHPSFIGLRGEQSELTPIKLAYGVLAEVDPESSAEDYLITHTARIFLIDGSGILRTNYPFGTPPEDILSDLEYLIGASS